jgi:hypothetical protein
MGKSALKTGLGFKACDEGYRKNQKGTSNATVSLALEKGVKDSETMAEAVDLYEGTDQMELPRHPPGHPSTGCLGSGRTCISFGTLAHRHLSTT